MIQFIIKDADGNVVSQGDIENAGNLQPGANQTVEFVDENGNPVAAENFSLRLGAGNDVSAVLTFADGSTSVVDGMRFTPGLTISNAIGTGDLVWGGPLMNSAVGQIIAAGALQSLAGSQLFFAYADPAGGTQMDVLTFDEIALVRLGSGSLPTEVAEQTSGQLLELVNAQLTAAGLATQTTVGAALESFVQQFDPVLVQVVNLTLDSQTAVDFLDQTTTLAPQILTEVVEVLETTARTEIPIGEPQAPAAPALDPLNPTEDDAEFSLTETLLQGANPGAQVTSLVEAEQTVVFASDSSTVGSGSVRVLNQIDPDTGDAARVGTFSTPGHILAQAADPDAGIIYVVNHFRQLLQVDAATGNLLTTPQSVAYINNLAWDPNSGRLLTVANGNLNELNPQTGQLTSIGPAGAAINALAYDSDQDIVYGIRLSTSAELMRFDGSGFVLVTSLLTPNGTDAGLTYDPNSKSLIISINGAPDQLFGFNPTTNTQFEVPGSPELNGLSLSALTVPGTGLPDGFAFNSATGEVTFDPTTFDHLGEGETETINFNYQIDGGAEMPGQINVQGVNDAPTATDNSFQVNRNITVDEVLGNVLNDGTPDSDPDASDTLTITSFNGVPVNPIQGASVFIDYNGETLTFHLAPNGDLSGRGRFDLLNAEDAINLTYEITDSAGATSTATIGIGDDPPVANDDNLNPILAADGPVVLNQQLLANDTDPEGDAFGITGVAGLPGLYSTFSNGSGSIRGIAELDPQTGSGNALPDYDDGETSNTFTYALAGNSAEGVLYVADSRSNLLTVNAETGEVLNNANSQRFDGLAFDPESGTLYGARSKFLFEVNPETGASTLIGNTPTVLHALAFDTAQNILYGVGASATQNLALYQLRQGTGQVNYQRLFDVGPTFGTAGLTFDEASGNLYYFNSSLNDQLQVIDIANQTATPVIGVDPGVMFNERGLAMVEGALPSGLSFNSATGELTFDPTNSAYDYLGEGETELLSFQYQVDGGDTATVQFDVVGQNDGPTANDDSFYITGNHMGVVGSVTTDPETGDTDPDANDSVSVIAFNGGPTGVTNPQSFEVNGETYTFRLLTQGGRLAAIGNFDNLPADHKFEFTYTISDGNGGTSTATITVNDDLAVAEDDTLQYSVEDGPMVLNQQLLANDFDPEGDPFAITSISSDGAAFNGPVSSLRASIPYGIPTNLTVLDPSTGAVNDLENSPQLTEGDGWNGIAVNSAEGVIYAVKRVTFPDFELFTLDSSTGEELSRVSLGSLNSVALAYDSDNGVLIGVRIEHNRAERDLISIDPETGATQVIAPTLSVPIYGLAYDSNQQKIYGVSQDALHEWDPATNQFVQLFQLSGFDQVTSLTYDTEAGELLFQDRLSRNYNKLFRIDLDSQTTSLVRDFGASSVLSGSGLGFLPTGLSFPSGLTFDETTGEVSFDPSQLDLTHLGAGETETYGFTYTVTGGDSATVELEVAGVNDGPTANDDSFQITGNHFVNTIGNVLTDTQTGDTDPDTNDTLRVVDFNGRPVVDSSEGAVVITEEIGGANYSFRMTADGSLAVSGDFDNLPTNEKIEFEYTISDGNGGTSTATISINDDPAVANDDSLGTFSSDSGPIVLNPQLLGNDVDPEGDSFGITGLLEPSAFFGPISSVAPAANYGVIGTLTALDPDTGTTSDLPDSPDNDEFRAMASDSENGLIFGINSRAQLVTMDANSGAEISRNSITGGGGAFFAGAAYDSSNQTLYATAISSNATVLYSIDTATGVATGLGSPVNTKIGGIAFDTDTQTLYGVGSPGSGSATLELYELNDSNRFVSQFSLGVSGNNRMGLAYDSENQQLLLTNQWNNTVYEIDVSSQSVTPARNFAPTDIHEGTLTYLPEGMLPPGLTYNPDTGEITFDPSQGDFSHLAPGQSQTYNFEYEVTGGDTAIASLQVVGAGGANPNAPVALDLDGDGLEFLTDAATGAAFDFNGDGTPEQTPWLSPDDAWLAIDLDNDGLISGGNELAFANHTPEADTDLEALRAVFDTDEDGQLTAADSSFGQFVLWQDANSDGVSDAGEVQTLAEAGIESIGLESDGVSHSAAVGEVTVHGEAEFTTTDGETGVVGDVELADVVSSENLDVAELATMPADGQNAPAQPAENAGSLATSATPEPAVIPAPPAPEVPAEAPPAEWI